MTPLPSLLHVELVRERGREDRRRAADARRLARAPRPAIFRSARDDDGDRRAPAPAAAIPGCC